MAQTAFLISDPDVPTASKARAFARAQMNLVVKLVPVPKSVKTIFKLGSSLVGGVDKALKGEAISSANKDKLIESLPEIALTAVLQVFGNGHLMDLKKIYDMASEVDKAGDLRALDVADILTLSAATMRGACLGVSFIFPVAKIPCKIGVKFIEVVRDTGLLELIPGIEEALDSVLDAIQNNPFIKAVVAPAFKFVFRGVQKISHLADALAVKLLKTVESFISRGVEIIFGGGRQMDTMQNLVVGARTKDKEFTLISGKDTKCKYSGDANNSCSTQEKTFGACKKECDTLNCTGFTHQKDNKCVVWLEDPVVADVGEAPGSNGCWARSAKPKNAREEVEEVEKWKKKWTKVGGKIESVFRNAVEDTKDFFENDVKDALGSVFR